MILATITKDADVGVLNPKPFRYGMHSELGVAGVRVMVRVGSSLHIYSFWKEPGDDPLQLRTKAEDVVRAMLELEK